jgi:hypothetical protein
MTERTHDRIAAAFERELARSPVPAGLRAEALHEIGRSARDLGAQRRWRTAQPLVVGLRGIGSLVAVLLVVALIATALLGGRVWRDWQQFLSRPAPAPAAGIDPVQLAQLRAKPLQLHSLQPGATCPIGPLTTIPYGGGPYDMYGGGPVYAIDAGLLTVNSSVWDGYWDMKLFVEPGVTGPLLIRARDLKTGTPLVFVGQYTIGDVVGTASIGGKKFQQHRELAWDVSQPRFETTLTGLGVWKFRVGNPRAPQPDLCAGFQVDGLNFSEVFVSYYLG